MSQILRLSKVMAKTGLSRSSIYLFASRNEFPKSISLGERSVGWVEEEIDKWINDRIKAARKPWPGEPR